MHTSFDLKIMDQSESVLAVERLSHEKLGRASRLGEFSPKIGETMSVRQSHAEQRKTSDSIRLVRMGISKLDRFPSQQTTTMVHYTGTIEQFLIGGQNDSPTRKKLVLLAICS